MTDWGKLAITAQNMGLDSIASKAKEIKDKLQSTDKRSCRDIALELRSILIQLGVDCYIYHVSKHGSTYIRFKDARIGSVRVGDHESLDKYNYKFSLRKDISGDMVKTVDGRSQWTCKTDEAGLKRIVHEIVLEAERVKVLPERVYKRKQKKRRKYTRWEIDEPGQSAFNPWDWQD
jgi:hypothetical protein